MGEMIKTSKKLCSKCVYSWAHSDNTADAVLCHYILNTGNRRGCPYGICDKFTKRKSKSKRAKKIVMKGGENNG